MDSKNRRILELLQQNAMLSAAEIAEQVGLTTTPCWRRIQKLEEQGVIERRVALLHADTIIHYCGRLGKRSVTASA